MASTAFIALRLNSVSGVEAVTYDGTNLKTIDTPAAISYTNGIWHHTVLVISAGNVMTLYVDGVSQGTIASAASSVAASEPEWSDPTATLQGDMSYGAIYSSALTGAQVLTHYQEGFTGFPLQDSITRANTVMTQLGALAPPDNFGTGISLVQQPSSSLAATSVMSYLQSLEQAENGFLYCDASGILQFLNRYAPIVAPRNVSMGVFGDASGEVPYKARPDVGLDNIDLFASSYVQALQTPTTGVPQTAMSATAQTKYGANATLVETGLLITSDFEALNRAQWNVGLYSSTKVRVRSIVVEPLGDPATRFPQVLYREILDRVTIRRRPWDSTSGTFGSPLFQQDQNIEGITHDINKQTPTWQTTITTWPALSGASAQFWVLGDPVLGVLGLDDDTGVSSGANAPRRHPADVAEIIHTAETHYSGQREPAVILIKRPGDPAPTMLPAERAAELAIHGHWHRKDADAFVPETTAAQPVLHAFVNDGRWLVQCPVCNGAQLASRGDPRFFCIDCLNEHAQRQWLSVAWPSTDQQAEIEGLLLKRPLTHTRSWKPDETTEKLRAENLAHGVAN